MSLEKLTLKYIFRKFSYFSIFFPLLSRLSPAHCWCHPTWATSGALRASTCRRAAWAPPSTWLWTVRPAPPPHLSQVGPAPARCTASSRARRVRTGRYTDVLFTERKKSQRMRSDWRQIYLSSGVLKESSSRKERCWNPGNLDGLSWIRPNIR